MYEFKSVSELNFYAGSVITSDSRLSSLSVTGEISGFKVYSSGHAYFTLKDNNSQIACVMFSSRLSSVSFKPKDGDKVTLTGSCGIYQASGKYQIVANTMKKAGQGDLKEQLRLLYEKLKKEGIFDEAHKKKLPMRPQRIGVISSASGAVIHDILVKLRMRNPYFDVLLYPAAVQGENCPGEVIEGVKYFEDKGNVDVIIIARGGGSIEDLMGFNDESLARAVYDCPIPVISAIGHETDYTILDFAADHRSPTPTAAAEDVLMSFDELSGMIENLRAKLNFNMSDYLSKKRIVLNSLRSSKALYSPEFTIKLKRHELDNLRASLKTSMDAEIKDRRDRLGGFIDSLAALGPHNVLKRGYSYVTTGEGTYINSVNQIENNMKVAINFHDGSCDAVITSKNPGKEEV